MRIKLKVSDSITHIKLKYDFASWLGKIDHFFYLFYASAFIFIGAYFFYEFVSLIDKTKFLLLGFTVAFAILGLLALYSLLTFDKLTRISGVTNQDNEKIISHLIERKFGKKPVASNNVLKYYRQPSFWKMGKRIIIILDGNNILINIATFNSRRVRSPFYSLFDRVYVERIKREIEHIKINGA